MRPAKRLQRIVHALLLSRHADRLATAFGDTMLARRAVEGARTGGISSCVQARDARPRPDLVHERGIVRRGAALNVEVDATVPTVRHGQRHPLA